MKLRHFDNDLPAESERDPMIVAIRIGSSDVVVKEFLFAGLVDDDQIVYFRYRRVRREGFRDSELEWLPMANSPDRIIGEPFLYID
jgi:hypothetical protein